MSTDVDEIRQSLESQREFLMRSLDDLEAEREAGNIDDDTYARLHGDYTARAAAVLRALDGEPVETSVGATPASAGRRTLAIGGIVVFAIAAAAALGFSIAPRLPGQTVTGGVTADPKAATAALNAAAHDHPNDYSARIAYARVLLGTDRVASLKEYDAAAHLRPKEPEPPTYIGWILGLASSQVSDAATRSQLLDQSLQELALARRLDPRYADAYVFEGLVRVKFAKDPAGAVPLLERYLKLAPDGGQAAAVRAALKDAKRQAKSATTSTTS